MAYILSTSYIRLSAGRLPRYLALSDIIKRASSSTGFSVVHETVHLDRGYGKCTEGMTVFPFFRRKYFISVSTCVDSFFPSALALTVIEPGSAALWVEVRKSHRNEGSCDRCIFQAIAIESSGVFGRDTDAFISRVGHLTTSISSERREAEFFCQRLSLATVRGNDKSVIQADRPSS